MTEILDIVNDKDEVIGQEERLIVHQKQLLHRYVHVLIVRSDGNLVIQQRHPKVTNYPSTFDASAGEHVRSGESYLDAAMRGLTEELGIETKVRFLAKIQNCLNPAIENMIGELFIGHHDGPYHPQVLEISRLEFMTIEELDFILGRYPYLICDNFKPSISAFMNANR